MHIYYVELTKIANVLEADIPAVGPAFPRRRAMSLNVGSGKHSQYYIRVVCVQLVMIQKCFHVISLN